MDTIPIKIQLISILGTSFFIIFISRLIIKGKLREEYSLIWIFCAAVLIIFSIWRNGLDYLSQALGVFYSPSLLFLFMICAIIIFLVHLSLVNSKQQDQIKKLAQELAILKNELENK